MQPVPADQVRKTWQQIAVSTAAALVALVSMVVADEVYRDRPGDRVRGRDPAARHRRAVVRRPAHRAA